MEALQKITDRLQTTVPDSTGNQCEKHLPKLVNLILVDGEEVCPLCERDQREAALSKEQSEKIRQAHAMKNYNAFLERSILTDKQLYNAGFKNYETQEPEEIENRDKAIQVYKRLQAGEVFNTWLTGMPGVGKSHLAMSILRSLNETGDKKSMSIFVSVDEMLRKIRGSFDNRESQYTESYFVDLLSSADFLVLDDLGAETGATGSGKRASDFTMRVLYAIANARQNKPTIITSNLSKDELTFMYDAKLVSRLMKDTVLIRFMNTSDKRIKHIEF